ncbi:MAG: DUF364 domain-containing protein [Anaerolineae bacterium]|nr:DUF364 domain-containing protein [Anaerolineae bacterium]
MNIAGKLMEQVAANAAEARLVDVRIGAHWSFVAFELRENLCAGLASTLGGSESHHHGGHAPVRDAGNLLSRDAWTLAGLINSESTIEVSIGFAAINALLEVDPAVCMEVNAADILAERGAGRSVAVVGHFPFIPDLRERVKNLWVLELNPREDDLPADQAPAILPQADVVALTGTSLLNHTFEGLVSLCRSDAYVVMLGGTTPLSPVLFEFGVDAVSGTLLVDPVPAMLAVSQGATFRQIPGKRLLTMFKNWYPDHR